MNNSAKFGLLLPVVLNPATAVIGIAALAIGVYRLLPDDDEEETVVTPEEESGTEHVALAIKRPLPTVELDDGVDVPIVDQAAFAPLPEVDQEEIIRSAMSELGKRSAAARAKKKSLPKISIMNYKSETRAVQ